MLFHRLTFNYNILGCGSVVEHLPSVCEALGLIIGRNSLINKFSEGSVFSGHSVSYQNLTSFFILAAMVLLTFCCSDKISKTNQDKWYFSSQGSQCMINYPSIAQWKHSEVKLFISPIET